MELANLEGLQTIIEHLPETFRRLIEDADNITQVRQRLDQDVSDELQKLMRYSPDAVVSALCYVIARDMDLMRLYALMQGKLLQMDSSLIDQAVAGKRPAVSKEAAA
jgi:V/A-type H+-transporting ATPase subunit C